MIYSGLGVTALCSVGRLAAAAAPAYRNRVRAVAAGLLCKYLDCSLYVCHLFLFSPATTPSTPSRPRVCLDFEETTCTTCAPAHGLLLVMHNISDGKSRKHIIASYVV